MPSSTLNLSELDGSNGFVINHLFIPNNRNETGSLSISSAGDINALNFLYLSR
jgi:hypothetical protein